MDGLADDLSAPGLDVRHHPDMQSVLWGKLLMNLNNALNALSGLPLAAQLADRNWRLLLADQMTEGLKVLSAHRIAPSKVRAFALYSFLGCCACQISFSALLRKR